MIAKPVVKNKFWIVEQEGKKVATIQQHTEGIAWVDTNKREQFANIDILKNHYNLHFDRPSTKSTKANNKELYGYPCDGVPFNGVWDLKHRVPLYTTTKKSKCYYAAGWYLLNDEIVFCPKYIYINRLSFVGPFKSEQEVNNAKISNP
jgi:hypothetical protein